MAAVKRVHEALFAAFDVVRSWCRLFLSKRSRRTAVIGIHLLK